MANTSKNAARTYTDSVGCRTTTRYEVQTRSGASWGFHCLVATPADALYQARKAKRAGYVARAVDLATGEVVS